jgi:hypothetical protein
LLKQLAANAKLTDAEIASLKDLNLLDQARIVERRLGGPEKLAEAVVQKLQVPLALSLWERVLMLFRRRHRCIPSATRCSPAYP